MKQYKSQNRSQKNSHSCVPLKEELWSKVIMLMLLFMNSNFLGIDFVFCGIKNKIHDFMFFF